jgi:hypothetical protein
LCSSIDRYQGCNTWKEFLTAHPAIDTVIETTVPWIHATDIPKLSAANPGAKEERYVIERLRQKTAERTETLKIYPFIWLKAFSITSSEQIDEVRQRIVARVRAYERELKTTKEPAHYIEGFNVTDSYVPTKRKPRISCLSSNSALRVAFLDKYARFVARCRNCYKQATQGVRAIAWPSECFPPRIPKLCNAL